MTVHLRGSLPLELGSAREDYQQRLHDEKRREGSAGIVKDVKGAKALLVTGEAREEGPYGKDTLW